MIYEKLEFSYDIKKLKSYLTEVVLPLPITNQSENFGGWSITSSNGDYRDGWDVKGFNFIEENAFSSSAELREALEKNTIPTSFDYVQPTQIYCGYIQNLIEDLKKKGLQPRRIRIIRLFAESSSIWHRDLPESTYGVRLHIPIETNAGCFFECDEGAVHLPADGSAYLLRVNRMHRVCNYGTSHRYHIVMDVTDRAGISRHHQFKF